MKAQMEDPTPRELLEVFSATEMQLEVLLYKWCFGGKVQGGYSAADQAISGAAKDSFGLITGLIL